MRFKPSRANVGKPLMMLLAMFIGLAVLVPIFTFMSQAEIDKRMRLLDMRPADEALLDNLKNRGYSAETVVLECLDQDPEFASPAADLVPVANPSYL